MKEKLFGKIMLTKAAAKSGIIMPIPKVKKAFNERVKKLRLHRDIPVKNAYAMLSVDEQKAT